MNTAVKAVLHNQGGSVLIISMILLLVLTVLGISGIKTSAMEEKMAGNIQNHQLAFQAAEATLREAEKYIDDNVFSLKNFDSDGTDGLYDRSTHNIWNKLKWDETDSIEYTKFDNVYSINSPPRYIIQRLTTKTDENSRLNLENYGQGIGAGKIEMFLITVRAAGVSNNSTVMLQTTYGKRL